jgi:alkylation response protein AidB-like acyl-CoA dehydrogenase
MLRDAPDEDKLSVLTAAVAADAASRDEDGAFPRRAFDELTACGVVAEPPLAARETRILLQLLAAVGRGDLNVGRIFEGHVNALLLIELYGDDAQRAAYRRAAEDGALFGVWNTDAPGDPLRIEDGRLQGKKNFASGVDGLSYAIVTVAEQGRRQMIVAPTAGLRVDRSWWRPLGMRASGSHVADFTGLAIQPDWALGKGDDYLAPPWFSAGAARFLAVQVGGAHAVMDAAVEHLRRTKRAADPHQAARLARMGTAVETGYLWLGRMADAWAIARAPDDDAALRATVDGGRVAVERAALDVLEEAERAVGAAGFIAPHRLERLLRDLRTYLRQPNPDGAAGGFGAAIASGEWEPGLALRRRSR